MLERAGYSILGTASVVLVLALASLSLGKLRHNFLRGVAAAFAAHLVALTIVATITLLTGRDAPRPLVLLVNPVIEETLRLFMLAIVIAKDRGESGLAYGLGFGGLESVTKLVELMLYFSGADFNLLRSIAAATAPAVPLLLHIALSVVAVALNRAKVDWLPIFLVTTTLHVGHNASVVFIELDNYQSLILSNLSRAAVLGGLIVGGLVLGRSISAGDSRSR